MASGTVTVISPYDEREPVVLPVGERPEGSALSSDESRLYVVNRESASISIIDTDTLTRLEPIKTRRGPVRICRGDAGTLLVALYHDQGLALIDPESPDSQGYLQLPGKAISINYDQSSGLATLSLIGDQVCMVDMASLSLTRCIHTRADPDPTAIVSLDPI
jgi:YVTN family beta-propeller protein